MALEENIDFCAIIYSLIRKIRSILDSAIENGFALLILRFFFGIFLLWQYGKVVHLFSDVKSRGISSNRKI